MTKLWIDCVTFEVLATHVAKRLGLDLTLVRINLWQGEHVMCHFCRKPAVRTTILVVRHNANRKFAFIRAEYSEAALGSGWEIIAHDDISNDDLTTFYQSLVMKPIANSNLISTDESPRNGKRRRGREATNRRSKRPRVLHRNY